MLHVTERDRVAVVQIPREIDIASSPILKATLDTLAEDPQKRIVLDFKSCEYCDSTAIGVLVYAKRSWGERCQIVIPLRSPVRRIIELTSLTDALQIKPTVAAAFGPQTPPSA